MSFHGIAPPFIRKLYKVLSKGNSRGGEPRGIRWNSASSSVEVLDKTELIPILKQNNLGTWAAFSNNMQLFFEGHQNGFTNEHFVLGQPALLGRIRKRTHAQGKAPKMPKQSRPLLATMHEKRGVQPIPSSHPVSMKQEEVDNVSFEKAYLPFPAVAVPIPLPAPQNDRFMEKVQADQNTREHLRSRKRSPRPEDFDCWSADMFSPKSEKPPNANMGSTLSDANELSEPHAIIKPGPAEPAPAGAYSVPMAAAVMVPIRATNVSVVDPAENIGGDSEPIGYDFQSQQAPIFWQPARPVPAPTPVYPSVHNLSAAAAYPTATPTALGMLHMTGGKVDNIPVADPVPQPMMRQPGLAQIPEAVAVPYHCYSTASSSHPLASSILQPPAQAALVVACAAPAAASAPFVPIPAMTSAGAISFECAPSIGRGDYAVGSSSNTPLALDPWYANNSSNSNISNNSNSNSNSKSSITYVQALRLAECGSGVGGDAGASGSSSSDTFTSGFNTRYREPVSHADVESDQYFDDLDVDLGSPLLGHARARGVGALDGSIDLEDCMDDADLQEIFDLEFGTVFGRGSFSEIETQTQTETILSPKGKKRRTGLYSCAKDDGCGAGFKSNTAYDNSDNSPRSAAKLDEDSDCSDDSECSNLPSLRFGTSAARDTQAASPVVETVGSTRKRVAARAVKHAKESHGAGAA